ncbi:MAG TPA: DUF4166 domain-containing protein [Burkholderiales bacterium]|nr:DUF4166 domain-containing protein [Burkholderiales bacterium]
MNKTVLVVGGYGVFGGRLTQLLVQEQDLRVIVAGRSLDQAQRFCTIHGGEPAAFDRDGEIERQINELAPDIVVDAAGPFQSYGVQGCRLARAALAAGAHYLDLADDAEFALGIEEVDALARERNRVAISGASSVPAISSAVVDDIAANLACVLLIESAILPGNRAPRGISVVRAILVQAGKPMRLWRGGAWSSATAWHGLRRLSLEVPGTRPIQGRWTSYIGAPDLLLFPRRYGARSVLFRAGLELAVLHLGLWLISWLPKIGVVRSLEKYAALMRWIADRTSRFGSDRGGMSVTVVGRDATSRHVRRTWNLIVESGQGPFIPALPAFLLTRKLLNGSLPAGARPCLGEFSLCEFEEVLRRFSARVHTVESSEPTLYEQILGYAYDGLPAPVRRVHDVHDREDYCGEASVAIGRSWLSRVCVRVMRLPRDAERVPLRVRMQRTHRGEKWTRRFGTHEFSSYMARPRDCKPGVIVERFGMLSFRLALNPSEAGLSMPIERAYFLGVLLPRWLTPISCTHETVDAAGRFHFDVDVVLPLAGRIVRYRGWLVPAGEQLCEK